MESRAQHYFTNIEAMTEHQVRMLLEAVQERRDFDIVDTLEEELERRGVILDYPPNSSPSQTNLRPATNNSA